MFTFIRNQMADVRELVYWSSLGANVVDRKFAFWNTTAVTRLDVWLVLAVTVATSGTCCTTISTITATATQRQERMVRTKGRKEERRRGNRKWELEREKKKTRNIKCLVACVPWPQTRTRSRKEDRQGVKGHKQEGEKGGCEERETYGDP